MTTTDVTPAVLNGGPCNDKLIEVWEGQKNFQVREERVYTIRDATQKVLRTGEKVHEYYRTGKHMFQYRGVVSGSSTMDDVDDC